MYHKLMLENQSMYTKLVFALLSEKNLSAGQPKVLEYLFTNDGAVQKDIAKACMIEPATMTSLLNGMEAKGLIEKKSRNGDKRYICVYLTEQGRTISEFVINAFSDVEETAMQGFTSEEKTQFLAFLERVNKNLIQRRKDDKNEKK